MTVGDLVPEDVLKSVQGGRPAPFYLFYGPSEFRLEKVLDRIRRDFIPESARDFNLEIFYGGEDNPAEIIHHARSLPFLAKNRLLIVRRTEKFGAGDLESFTAYLEKPVESTCLIFVSSKTDFNKKFYKMIRASGRALHFQALKESQVVPWIKRAAKELGLDIEVEGCAYIHQIVGNNLRELHAELEKLYLRYGDRRVGPEEVKELAIHSRIYSIFELMGKVSSKKCAESLDVLNRFLEEEDMRLAPLQVIGMLNRQVRLLWRTKAMLSKGRQTKEVAKNLGIPYFSAKDFASQSKLWTVGELERGLDLLYQADGLVKSGSPPKLLLENFILSVCT